MDNPVDKVDNSAKRHIFSHSGAVVGLFARQPVPGQVKTRLTPPLTAEQACRLYQSALLETVAQLRACGMTLVICYDGALDWFRDAFPGVPLLRQVGDDLGARMRHAVEALFEGGAGPVLLAGSDSPDLPAALLEEVLVQLRFRDAAVVPCRDGGYALVGLRKPVTALFEEVPWSTSRVMAATRRRARRLGLSLHETAVWHDLDELDDLRRLVVRSPQSLTARHILRELHELL